MRFNAEAGFNPAPNPESLLSSSKPQPAASSQPESVTDIRQPNVFMRRLRYVVAGSFVASTITGGAILYNRSSQGENADNLAANIHCLIITPTIPEPKPTPTSAGPLSESSDGVPNNLIPTITPISSTPSWSVECMTPVPKK